MKKTLILNKNASCSTLLKGKGPDLRAILLCFNNTEQLLYYYYICKFLLGKERIFRVSFVIHRETRINTYETGVNVNDY